MAFGGLVRFKEDVMVISQPRQSRMRIHFVGIILLACCLGAVVNSGAQPEPYNYGKVIDAETKEPLENVLIFQEVIARFRTPDGFETSESLRTTQTAFTNSKGEYKISLGAYPKTALPSTTEISTEISLTFVKPGYFEDGDYSPENVLPRGPFSVIQEMRLYKMTHYLNYLYYKEGHSRLQAKDGEDCPKVYQDAILQIKNARPSPADDMGVFLRLEGCKLNRVLKRGEFVERYFQKTVYYFLDSTSGNWWAVDSRGKRLNPENLHLPRWDFFIPDSHWLGAPIPPYIYANQKFIFYPKGLETPEGNWEETQGGIVYIPAHAPDITAMAGKNSLFFTIEGNGRLLCSYEGGYRKVTHHDGVERKEDHLPHFLESYSANDLPASDINDGVKKSQFKFLIQSPRDDYLVVTKTPDNWHLYRLFLKSQKKWFQFKEIDVFPASREITAVAQDYDSLFISFKGEGVRKYSMFYSHGKNKLKEDVEFHKRLSKYIPSDLSSMVLGSAGDVRAIYATGNDDRVYRFSLNGVPDFRIKGSLP